MFELFEGFTRQGNQAMRLAREESGRMGYDSVGIEHLLLGIIAEYDSAPARILRSMNVDLCNARIEAEELIGLGGSNCDTLLKIPFSDAAQQILKQATRLGSPCVTTIHLMQVILTQEGPPALSKAPAILTNLQVDLSNLARELSTALITETIEVEADTGVFNTGSGIFKIRKTPEGMIVEITPTDQATASTSNTRLSADDAGAIAAALDATFARQLKLDEFWLNKLRQEREE